MRFATIKTERGSKAVVVEGPQYIDLQSVNPRVPLPKVVKWSTEAESVWPAASTAVGIIRQSPTVSW